MTPSPLLGAGPFHFALWEYNSRSTMLMTRTTMMKLMMSGSRLESEGQGFSWVGSCGLQNRMQVKWENQFSIFGRKVTFWPCSFFLWNRDGKLKKKKKKGRKGKMKKVKRGSSLVSLCDHSALQPQANFRSLNTAIASGPRREGADRPRAGWSAFRIARGYTKYKLLWIKTFWGN